jgi:hypothetical protein
VKRKYRKLNQRAASWQNQRRQSAGLKAWREKRENEMKRKENYRRRENVKKIAIGGGDRREAKISENAKLMAGIINR